MALSRRALEQFLEELKTKEGTVAPVTDKAPPEVTKKEIHLKKKHYGYIKQQLKTQVAAFKPEQEGFLSASPNFKIVQVNERVERQRALDYRIPVREVTVELQHKDYLMGRHASWHAHLYYHRMTQLDEPRVPKGATTDNKTSSLKNQTPASLRVPPPRPTSIKKLINCPFPSEVARRLRLYE